MPGLVTVIGAAMGSAVSAVGSITLGGLATGAMVAGTAMSAIGAITGSKTLTKIGMGLGLAGGVGGLAAGMTGTGALTLGNIGKNMTSGGKSGLLNTNNIDNILSTQTKGSRSASDIVNFKKPDFNQTKDLPSMDSFAKNSGNIGLNGAKDLDLEKNYFQRANETLTKYNPMANILGGMGEAYMANETMNLRRDLVDKQLAFDQQLVDRVSNNNVPLGINVSPSIMRNPNAYQPLLQRNQ